MLTRLTSVATVLLASGVAAAYTYWNMPPALFFVVAPASTVLLVAYSARLMCSLRRLGAKSLLDDAAWPALLVLLFFAAASIARMAVGIAAGMWAILSFNIVTWHEHSFYSFMGGLSAALLVMQSTIRHHMRKTAGTREEVYDGGSEDIFAPLAASDARGEHSV